MSYGHRGRPHSLHILAPEFGEGCTTRRQRSRGGHRDGRNRARDGIVVRIDLFMIRVRLLELVRVVTSIDFGQPRQGKA